MSASPESAWTGAVQSTEGRQLTIRPDTMPARVSRELCRQLTLVNPEYVAAVQFGRWTGALEPELRYYEALPDGGLAIPRGCGAMLRELCRAYGLALDVDDATVACPPVDFAAAIALSPAQERAVKDILASSKGQLVAPAVARR